MFPAGSVNHAIGGPSPRQMPFSSVGMPSYRWNCTPRPVSSSTALSMSSTGKLRIVFVERAWDPPAAYWGDRLLGGRDRTAGGTWLAVDPAGPAVAAVLNGVRRPPPEDGTRPSRGQLPLAALRGQPLPDPETLARYDGFHLVLGTPREVRVWSWDGTALRDTELPQGDHVIVNGGVGAADPSLAAALGRVG